MEILQKHITPVKRNVIKAAGLQFDLGLDDDILAVVNSIFFQGLALAKPCFEKVILNAENVDKSFIPQSFAGISKIMFFVSSLGLEIDEKINEFIKNNQMLKASVLDVWASQAIETLNKSIDKHYDDLTKKRTRRFSPGYGDLSPLINNKILNTYFKNFLVKANAKSGMLTPCKSTVCLVGWYNEPR